MNEPKKFIEYPLCMVVFILPVAIYELRVAWLYFRHGRITTPLAYYIISFASLFLPYTLEEYMEKVNKTFNVKPRTVAIISGLQGLIFLLLVILSVIFSFVY
jgi:hypothetical protein